MPLNLRVSLREPVLGCVGFSSRISRRQVEGKPCRAALRSTLVQIASGLAGIPMPKGGWEPREQNVPSSQGGSMGRGMTSPSPGSHFHTIQL